MQGMKYFDRCINGKVGTRFWYCCFVFSLLQFPVYGQGPSLKPNIVWMVTEDISPYLASYGDSTVKTPNLDRLAREGVRYTNVFSVSGVCVPSCLITGLYPTSIGTIT